MLGVQHSNHLPFLNRRKIVGVIAIAAVPMRKDLFCWGHLLPGGKSPGPRMSPLASFPALLLTTVSFIFAAMLNAHYILNRDHLLENMAVIPALIFVSNSPAQPGRIEECVYIEAKHLGRAKQGFELRTFAGRRT